MALLRILDQTERRHDRPHRTVLGMCRTVQYPNGSRAHARVRCTKQPEGGRMLPLASPPPPRGRGHFPEPASSEAPPHSEPHSAAIWREMMSRWMSDVPS